MAKKYYSQTVNKLVNKFEPWMAIANNAQSNGQRFLSPFAIQYDELLEKFTRMEGQWNIETADIYEIYETWAIEAVDIIYNTTTSSIYDLLREVTSVTGHYPKYELNETTGVYDDLGETSERSITIVDTEEEMYKALPTAYMYSEIFDGPDDDIYKSLQYIDGSIRIKLDQRGLEKEIQLTRSKDPSNTNVSVDITSEAYDQNMEFLREEETTFIDAYTNYRPSSPVIKDSLLIFAFGETIDAQPSNIVIPSGYYFIGSGVSSDNHELVLPWTNDNSLYRSDFDYDNDGIINEVEIQMITNVLGTNRDDENISEEQWSDEYSKFDINGDNEITIDDYNTLKDHIVTTSDDTTNILLFKIPGQFLIQYDTVGGGGITGYTIKDEALQNFRNDTFGDSIPISNPSGYRDVAYDQFTDSFFFLDDDEKSIYAELFNELNETVDKYKIQLPVTSFDERMGGISKGREGTIYAIGSDEEHEKSNLYIVDIHSDDVRGSAKRLPCYEKIPATRKFIVGSGYLPLGFYGVTNFHGDSLITTSGNKLYLMEPIYDVGFYSLESDRLHIRSWHDKFSSDTHDSLEMEPYWNAVWNEFDEAAWKIGLMRLPGESNAEFKFRILDVNDNYAHASEQGYVNGITREIGEERFDIETRKIITLERTPLDPTEYTFEVVASLYNPIGLIVDYITEVPVKNSADILLYNKYEFYGTDPFTAESDALLYTLDNSIVELMFSFTPEFQDAVRIAYWYEDSDGESNLTEDTIIIDSIIIPPEEYMEVIRVSDSARFTKSEYGYYDASGYPTSKMNNLVGQLRQIDNTTWWNIVANSSRFDTNDKSYAGNTRIPHYWQ